MPGMTVDARMDSIAPPPPAPPRPPPAGAGSPGTAVRSGLIELQCAPASVDVHTDWNAAMSIRLFHGAKMIGCELVVRSRLAGSAAGLTLIHSSLGYEIFTMPL